MKLKTVLYAFLYDSIDTEGLEPNDCDEEFIDLFIKILVKKDVCPYINYSCEDKCKNIDFCKNKNTPEMDCGKDKETIWKEFILGTEKPTLIC